MIDMNLVNEALQHTAFDDLITDQLFIEYLNIIDGIRSIRSKQIIAMAAVNWDFFFSGMSK